MKFKFYKHAKLKFADLRKIGFRITQEEVIKYLRNPDKVVYDPKTGRLIAENYLNHLKLRIVYIRHRNYLEIVTFYPTKKERYEI